MVIKKHITPLLSSKAQIPWVVVELSQDAFEIELLEGRDFSPEFSTDLNGAVLINETFVKAMGWKNPVGKKISVRNVENGQVIGVIKDFNFYSVKSHISPLVHLLTPIEKFSEMGFAVRIESGNIPETIQFLKKTVEKYSIDHPFGYYFFNEKFNELYKTEQKLGSIFKYFAVLAIFLACLGLFGMASFLIKKRTKEMGIRKVLGASGFKIFQLLSWGFLSLVALANIIAWPVAYYVMNKWLQGFAYRVNINIITFIIATAFTLIVSILSVSFQSVRAARANPIDSLKYE